VGKFVAFSAFKWLNLLNLKDVKIFHVMPVEFGMPTAHTSCVRDAAQHPECVLESSYEGIQDDDEKNDKE
jgi:hypothetical protein